METRTRHLPDRPLLVLGGGGHAKVLIDALQSLGAEILGILDPRMPAGEEGPLGVRFLGDDSVADDHEPDRILLVNGIGSTPRARSRRRDIYERFRQRGYAFASVVHPAAWLSPAAEISAGAQVLAGACVQAGAHIAGNAILNTNCSVDHDTQIGKHVHVAPGATISGCVKMAEDVHVGTGASIIEGISVGAGAVIGAGAVVTKDVGEGYWVLPAEVRLRRPRA